MVNCAHYGFPARITTITHAVVILGFGEIRKLLLAAVMGTVLSRHGAAGFDRHACAIHGLATATASQLLARRCAPQIPGEEAFIAGLLHDLGKVILESLCAPQFARILAEVRAGGDLPACERTWLGTDHSALAAVVLEHWNLPPGLVAAVRHHHRPSLARRDPLMPAIVHLGDAFAHALGHTDGVRLTIPALEPAAPGLLRLGVAEVPAVVRELEAEMERSSAFLRLLLEGEEQ